MGESQQIVPPKTGTDPEFSMNILGKMPNIGVREHIMLLKLAYPDRLGLDRNLNDRTIDLKMPFEALRAIHPLQSFLLDLNQV